MQAVAKGDPIDHRPSLADQTTREDTAVAIRSTFLTLFTLTLVTLALTACGSTWEGVKEDTGDNLEATGEAIEDAGEAVKPEG